MSDLAPCPFCGGKAVVDCYFDVTGNKRPDTYRAHCVFGCGRSSDELTRENAITAWNRRAPDLEAQIAAMPGAISTADTTELREAHAALGASLDDDFGLWSSPTFTVCRRAAYPLWKAVNAHLAAMPGSAVQATRVGEPIARELLRVAEDLHLKATTFGGRQTWDVALALEDASKQVCTAADAILAALTAPVPGGDWRPTHRHVKRGTDYEVLGTALIQTASNPLLDDQPMVVYRSEDGRLWIRHPKEFEDGRFERLKAEAPAPSASGATGCD